MTTSTQCSCTALRTSARGEKARKYNLALACEELGVAVESTHGALVDAQLTSAVFRRIAPGGGEESVASGRQAELETGTRTGGEGELAGEIRPIW